MKISVRIVKKKIRVYNNIFRKTLDSVLRNVLINYSIFFYILWEKYRFDVSHAIRHTIYVWIFLFDNYNHFRSTLHNIKNRADLPCEESDDEKKTITRIFEKNSSSTVYNLRRRLYESKDFNWMLTTAP